MLLNAGYRVSLSHANRMAVKTDAPNDFVWRMMRAIKDKNTCEGRKEHKGTGMATLTQCCNLKKGVWPLGDSLVGCNAADEYF